MELNNISNGMHVKNYKELCLLLNEPIKGGDSKKAQLKDWERYFKYHKDGKTSFVIDEVYDTAQPKKVRGDTIYTKLIELILMNQLSLSDKYTIEATKRNLYEMLGLVNNNYSDYKQKNDTVKAFAKKHSKDTIGCSLPVLTFKASEFYCNHFFTFTNNRLDKILQDALWSMSKRDLIHYSLIYKIVTIENNKEGYLISAEKRDASKDEVKLILEGKQAFRKEHPEFNYITSYNYADYAKALNAYFKEAYGWDEVYSVMNIIINEKYIRESIPVIQEELQLECEKQKIELNMVAVNKFNEYFENQYIKHQIKCYLSLKEEIAKKLSTNVHDKEKLKELTKMTELELADFMAEQKTTDFEVYKNVLDKDYVSIQKELVQMFMKITND